ncbi:MAG TPA: glycosyltransferase family 39 protein [Streptosporangiaceae bacterium]|nr:glycosyltransferase family 39 protein [Streptosporangiaceae bacterium]
MLGTAVVLIPGFALLLADGYRLGALSLWRDEAYTLDGAGRPVARILAMLPHTDAVNSPYYVVMHGASAVLGTSATALRLPSLLGMAVAAVVTAVIGRRLAHAARLPAPALTGVLAGLLMVTAPQVTKYAQEARSYGLVTMCATIASYLLLRALADDRWRWWAAYSGAILLAGLLNLLALLLLAAHGVTVWAAGARLRQAGEPAGRPAPEQPTGQAAPELPGGQAAPELRGGQAAAELRGGQAAPELPGGQAASLSGAAATRGSAAAGPRWLLLATVVTVLLSPLAAAGFRQRHQISWLARPGGNAVSHLVVGLAGSDALVPLAAGLVVGCVIACLAVRPRAAVDIATLAGPWLVLPPAILLAVSQVHPMYDSRYIVYTVPAFALLAAGGLAWLTRVTARILRGQLAGVPARWQAVLAWIPAALALALLAVLVIGPQQAIRLPGSRPDNLRQAAAVIAARARPGDAVLYLPSNKRVFSMGYPAPYRRLRDVALALSPAAADNLIGTEVPVPVLRARFASVQRVWVISGRSRRLFRHPVSRLNKAEVALLRTFHLIGRWYVGQGMVSLFGRNEHHPRAARLDGRSHLRPA